MQSRRWQSSPHSRTKPRPDRSHVRPDLPQHAAASAFPQPRETNCGIDGNLYPTLCARRVAAEQDLMRVDQAMDRLLDRCEFPGRGADAMFHLSVVFEERHTQHHAMLVIHLD